MSTRRPDALELLRWWHQYQARKMNRTADCIRNGLMQELFAIRRQLEVSCQAEENADKFGCDLHLTNLEDLYNHLEHISHDLNSPFLDSLPLALQHSVRPWCAQLPLTTELPSDWPSEPVETVNLLLAFADSFFRQIATVESVHKQCGLKLTRQAGDRELICYAIGDKTWHDHNSSINTRMLLPFLETFRLLTQGEYHQILQPQQVGWILRWQPLSSIIPKYHHD